MQIGKYHLATMIVKGKEVVSITTNTGEGGTFDIEKFEKVIDELYNKEF